MRTLALDTTTRAGGVALVADGAIVAERIGDLARSHAERLPADLLDLLSDGAMPLETIDLFAVASGPGGFTGLRIGIATIQGLAFTTGRPVAPVSALEALAYTAIADAVESPFVGAWMDAHRGEVFSALYRLGAGAGLQDGRLEEVEAASVGAPEETAARWRALAGAAIDVVGDGAARYRDALRACGRLVTREHRTLAGTIGLLAGPRAARGLTVPPDGIRPLYVRRPDAERDRDRRARDVALDR